MTYKTTAMNNNDFKVICVFNFLISIQLPLKRAQVEVSMQTNDTNSLLKIIIIHSSGLISY